MRNYCFKLVNKALEKQCLSEMAKRMQIDVNKINTRGIDWGSTHREYTSCGFREAGHGIPVQCMPTDFLTPLDWQDFPELRMRNI